MKVRLILGIVVLGSPAAAQRIAYDEFDGTTRAGFAREGIGEWSVDGAVERDGKLTTINGNSWRELETPVSRALVWYAVTMRVTEPIEGYASVVPAWSRSTQYSELGFNSGYGHREGMWTASGVVKTKVACTQMQTFLQRYDLAAGMWSAWAAPGDGLTLIDDAGNVTGAPLVHDAALGGDTLSHIYITKGSMQVLEIERLAIAMSAKDALVPAKAKDPVVKVVVPPPAPLSPGFEALVGENSALRIGERIAFFGDSITWQAGYIDLLERALAIHQRDKHVTLLRNGVDGARSRDLLADPSAKVAPTQTLAQFLAKDRPSIISIMIGINDVWHADERTNIGEYEANLRELVRIAKSEQCCVVLCTPTIIGELPKNANRFDSALDSYAAVVRTVARETGCELCDTHQAFVDRLAEQGQVSRESGLLTYDGVHMLPRGNELIASTLGDALARAARSSSARSSGSIVPEPSSVRLRARVGGATGPVLGPRLRIRAPATELRAHAQVLAAEIAQAFGIPALITTDSSEPADIELLLDMNQAGSAADGYRLEINPLAQPPITLRARTQGALASGSASLLQLMDASLRERQDLPACSIVDSPAFDFRALLVDVARRPHTIATLESLIELCRLYKLNYLQLHLTDDQAFTFPSRAFPKLVTERQHFSREELLALVEFARVRGVTLLPELEMPGHAGAMVAAMPELFRAHKDHHATLNFANVRTLEALDTLLAEVAEVFSTSPYIHIGGDEADLTRVAESPDFQAAFAREHVSGAHELYVRFLIRMNESVKRLGKRTLVWEGFGPDVGASVPKDITVVAYEALYYPPEALVRNGFNVINASWKPLYVVNDRHWSPREIHAWNPWLFEHFIENFPAFHGIQLPPQAAIVGAMMCAWEQPDELELPSLRLRVAAFSERIWNPRVRTSFEDLERASAATDALLSRLLVR